MLGLFSFCVDKQTNKQTNKQLGIQPLTDKGLGLGARADFKSYNSRDAKLVPSLNQTLGYLMTDTQTFHDSIKTAITSFHDGNFIATEVLSTEVFKDAAVIFDGGITSWDVASPLDHASCETVNFEWTPAWQQVEFIQSLNHGLRTVYRDCEKGVVLIAASVARKHCTYNESYLQFGFGVLDKTGNVKEFFSRSRDLFEQGNKCWKQDHPAETFYRAAYSQFIEQHVEII